MIATSPAATVAVEEASAVLDVDADDSADESLLHPTNPSTAAAERPCNMARLDTSENLDSDNVHSISPYSMTSSKRSHLWVSCALLIIFTCLGSATPLRLTLAQRAKVQHQP